MNQKAILAMGAWLAGAFLADGVAAGEGTPAPKGDARIYTLSFSPSAQAANLVREPCGLIDVGCRVNIVNDTVLSVLASAEAQAKVAELLRQVDVPPRSHTFHLAVLAAGMESEPHVDLPEGAARALAESGRLLPYKGYRLLEQGLLTTTDQGRIALGDPATGFEARLKMEGGADPGSPLLIRSFELTRAKWEQVGENIIRRTVIDTSFTIKPGETVVLGASRLDGSDQALVVLVSAVGGA